MTLDEAHAAVGKLVMSRDPGYKMVPDIGYWHGPYELRKVTKGGLCILRGREQYGGWPARIMRLATEEERREQAVPE
jgi:hypothetical protein